jgi:plasmid maintenance system antidote protein VapI
MWQDFPFFVVPKYWKSDKSEDYTSNILEVKGYDMEFADYIRMAIEKTPRHMQKELAEIIGVRETHMSSMVKGKMAIPDKALVKMAVLIGEGVTPGQIWEAQQAARAATEEERQLWLPFVKGARGMAHAASIFVTVATIAAGTIFVSPTPAKAAPVLNLALDQSLLCKVTYRNTELITTPPFQPSSSWRLALHHFTSNAGHSMTRAPASRFHVRVSCVSKCRQG